MNKFFIFVGMLLLLSGCFKENGKLMITVFVPHSSLSNISDNAIVYIDEVKKVSSMGGGMQLEVEEGKHKLKVVHESQYYKYIYEKNINITGKTSISIPIYFKENTTLSEKDNVHEIKKLFYDLLKKYNIALTFEKKLELNKAKNILTDVRESYKSLLIAPENKIYFYKNLEQSNFLKMETIDYKIIELELKLNKPTEILNYASSNHNDFKLFPYNFDHIIAAHIKIGNIDEAMSYIAPSNLRYNFDYISERQYHFFSELVVKALLDNSYAYKANQYMENQTKMLEVVAEFWSYNKKMYSDYTSMHQDSLDEYNKIRTQSNIKKVVLPQNSMKVFKKRLIAQYMQENGRIKTYELLKDVELKLKSMKLKNVEDFANLSFDYYNVMN